jgi:hypothetical protein
MNANQLYTRNHVTLIVQYELCPLVKNLVLLMQDEEQQLKVLLL